VDVDVWTTPDGQAAGRRALGVSPRTTRKQGPQRAGGPCPVHSLGPKYEGRTNTESELRAWHDVEYKSGEKLDR